MLPFVWLRFADWQPLIEMEASDLDPSGDGVSVSSQVRLYSRVRGCYDQELKCDAIGSTKHTVDHIMIINHASVSNNHAISGTTYVNAVPPVY